MGHEDWLDVDQEAFYLLLGEVGILGWFDAFYLEEALDDGVYVEYLLGLVHLRNLIKRLLYHLIILGVIGRNQINNMLLRVIIYCYY